MQKNTSKAFTLIEVMVVLSVLAIIAILSYNFFGSVIKDARLDSALTQVKRDCDAIATAFENYSLKNGELATGNYNASMGTIFVDSGEMKAFPTPPYDYFDPAGATDPDPVVANYRYILDHQRYSIFDNVPNNNSYLYLRPVTEEFCRAWNDKYTTLGATIPSTSFPYSGTYILTDPVGPGFCFYLTNNTAYYLEYFLR